LEQLPKRKQEGGMSSKGINLHIKDKLTVTQDYNSVTILMMTRGMSSKGVNLNIKEK
jgi:hypothetical protein